VEWSEVEWAGGRLGPGCGMGRETLGVGLNTSCVGVGQTGLVGAV
jgi:hypothetical protein